jgi:CheY-like chemotaxis protein
MQQIDLIRIYQRKSALVIDDFPDMRGSIRRMLLATGVGNVDLASSGAEAISRCEHHRYDIILADYNLGDAKNGQQILEELRYRGLLRNTSIYMMITAETTKAMVFGALEYQPDDYLTKPFTQTTLQLRLNRLVMEKEELRDIHRALDDSDHEAVIALCDEHISAGDRYSQRCLRMKARSLYELRRLDEASAIYRQVLAERPLDWALIGEGRCLMARGDWDAAERIFQKLVDNNCLCLEVYDYLAEIRRRRGDIVSAQELLERASDISPNAILRQQVLAEISEENGDWERAEKAHRRVIRLSANSCHEAPENYFRYARCIATQLHQQQNGSKDHKRLKEVDEVLERARRRYRDDQAVKLQADLIAVAAQAGAGAVDEARQKLVALEQQLQKRDPAAEALPIALTLELARAHQAVGNSDAARQLLLELAEAHGGSDAIWEQIDRVSEEPLSDKGKARAVELNQRGKELFGRNQFEQAIDLFAEALRFYPNNIGLKLNLLLALVKQMVAAGSSPELLARAAKIHASIGTISTEHPLYDRYQTLGAHVARLQESSDE